MDLLSGEIVYPFWVVIGIVFVVLAGINMSKIYFGSVDDTSSTGTPFKQYGIKDAPFKMLLCVNTTLGMGKGKIASQCCHAALGAYKLGVKHNKSGVQWWETTGCAKIAVKVSDLEMREMEHIANVNGLVTYMVRDAGRTQIAAGSETVLAIGPAPVHDMKFTNHLKLL